MSLAVIQRKLDLHAKFIDIKINDFGKVIGYKVKMGMDNSLQAWVTDPDGNQIELMEYGPSSLQLTGAPSDPHS